MANDLKIFGGDHYFLSFYDATNGWLHLEQMVKADVTDKPANNTTIEGQLRRYETVHKLSVNIVESDQELIDELNTRVPTKQIIYLLGFDHLILFNDVYFVPFVKRIGKAHSITVEASTNINADVQHKINIAPNPGMENNASGLADEWNESGASSSTSIVTSFRTGDAQRMSFDYNNNDKFYSDNIYFPVRDGQTLTASFYMKESGAINDLDMLIKIEILASDGSTVLDTITSEVFTAEIGGAAVRASVTGTVSITSEACFVKLTVYPDTAPGGSILDMDDFQLEIGNLSTYKDY